MEESLFVVVGSTNMVILSFIGLSKESVFEGEEVGLIFCEIRKRDV